MIFSVGVCIVLLNYGGAFGVIPSLVKESYGAKLMATMYGVALTAWGVGGFWPQITAYMKDHFGAEAGTNSFMVALF
jgi:OFA family oxalate/formate antiporter-like MFS transporter